MRVCTWAASFSLHSSEAASSTPAPASLDSGLRTHPTKAHSGLSPASTVLPEDPSTSGRQLGEDTVRPAVQRQEQSQKRPASQEEGRGGAWWGEALPQLPRSDQPSWLSES